MTNDKKLVSMKLPPREQTKEDRLYPSTASDQPEYPWGTRITLEDEQLKALGITTLPAVDTEVTITATAKVCCTSMYEDQGDKQRRSIGLQITDLAVE